MIKLTLKGLKEAQDQLRRFERSIPFAVRNALNEMAFDGRRLWQAELPKSFNLKNQFTVRSVLVDKATGTNITGMRAVLGSRAPYMNRQEVGGVQRGKSPHVPIPGPVAAGQAPGSRRTRLVRAGNKLARIQAHKGKGTNRRQHNAVAMAIAKRSGSKFALLRRPGGGRGLFIITGSRRKLRARLLWDVTRGSVRIPPSPTLAPVVAQLKRRAPIIMLDALKQQCRRNKLFGL